jgi:hypothetical protein
VIVAEPAAGSPAASPFAPLERAHATLLSDPRFADHAIVRPHPLLVTVRRGDLFVLLAPAEVSAAGRDALRPFTSRLGSGGAMLVWLGGPIAPHVDEALNRGLSAIVPRGASADELFVAIHNAFELMEARARAESRGKWLNRYRYELGELIEIAKSITTEREIDRCSASSWRRAASSPARTPAASTSSRATTPIRSGARCGSSSRRTTRATSTRASSRCP